MNKRFVTSLLALLWALGTLQAQVYQLPNPGFEQWDGTTFTGNNVSEPTGWNSFGTANATISMGASTARQTHHTRKEGHRPGGTGNYYLTIWTKSVNFFIVNTKANGNMTTGRIKIGSTTATDLTQNYNYTDRSGGYAQPFDGTPDSMYVWVSYWAASATDQAGISCYLHGNSDFRDPTDGSNTAAYCGKAEAQFGRTRGSASAAPVWQQVRVPFVYDGTSTVNYILMTLNTNTTPAGGSANDSLSIDDIEFIYSAWLNDLTVNGQTVDNFAKDQFTYYLDGYVDSTFRGITIGYTREAADATVSIDSVYFEDSYMSGMHYTVHVVAEDGVTQRDYHLYCYIEQTGSALAQYTIGVESADETMGSVTGSGVYFEGNTVTLTAMPAAHHHFTHWQDGVTMNPRSFTATSDSLFTAYFALDEHHVELYTSPSYFGSVQGAGLYPYGDTALLSATAPEHYHFYQWSDGNQDNPRAFVVTGDTALWALFELDQHTLTLTANDEAWGTVQGTGVYAYGDSLWMSAQASEHYHFVAWNDGCTDNPRAFQLLGDTSFTALFAIDQHLVACTSNPEGAATFLGEGLHDWGETLQLEAVAQQGFSFLQWADGVQDNPRTVTVLADTTFAALFSTLSYTLSVNSQPAEGGIVMGGGSYTYGATVTLMATPSEGWHFTMWADSTTANPRTVTVEGNATYIALFVQNPDDPDDYLITTASNNPLWGSVSGGGLFPEGTTATLTALPAMNYHFVQWHDGDNHNPRTITVIHDATYTATFAPDQHTVTLTALPANGGTVSGHGSYAHGSSAILSAIPAEGYHFAQWNDANTQNPRTIIVVSDTLLAASFDVNEYSVTATSAHQAWGTVYGGGTYTHGSQATLTAQPAEGCRFLQWSDGNTQNPRTLTVTGDATLTALFAQNEYTLHLVATPAQGGTLYGAGTYTHGAQATLIAMPRDGYRFLQWSDSVAENPRTLLVTGNMTLTAEFEQTTHTVSVLANVNDWGTVQGGGIYAEGATAVLQALPYEGYHFVQWNDGETANPRTLSVTEDRLFIATFAPDAATYTITATANNQGGTVTGGGIYPEGTQVVLEAIAHEGWQFAGWNDGAPFNPRTVTVTQDALYIATFTPTAGISILQSSSLQIYPNPASDHLMVEGYEGEAQLYDLQGRLVKTQIITHHSSLITLDPLPQGVYLLRCGNELQRVVKK